MKNNLGLVFGEGVHKGRKRAIHQDKEKYARGYSLRLILTVVISVFLLGILITRLFELTIIKGGYYRNLASGNRIREKKITAPRGIIYDKDGKALVHNVPAGENEVTREYPYGETLAHLMGYIGEIDEEEMMRKNRNLSSHLAYKLGDFVGKTGIEKYYEDKIRGIDGRELLEFDASGDMIRSLGRVEPRPGSNLHLSLSLPLQKIASSSMEGKTGAVIASNPINGEILAFYSAPSFDPNAFIKGINIETILEDKRLPLFDRVIGGVYPPGSTFKIITSVAGLETKAVEASTQYEDVGVLRVGEFSFPNWYFNQYGKKEGMVDMVKAIKRSNDIYFYKVGEKLGIDRLGAWARRMGVGKTLGIDLEGEEAGVMPDDAWKRKVRGEQWYLGDTYHVAIGQGDLLTTPLQVNVWTNAIANGGKLCKPHLVGNQKQDCKDLGIKKENIEVVRRGMIEACQPGGTGYPLFKFQIPNSKFQIDGRNFLETYESTTSAKKVTEIVTACKTGTAEYGDPKNKTHAWFTIFAPAYDPQISITVLVEGGGEGSSVAAPIAKKMLEEWFGVR